MKNDFKQGKTKISVPPTLLFSMSAKLDDIRKTTPSHFISPEDQIYLVGKTRKELGCSELYRHLNIEGGAVPKVNKEEAKELYNKVFQAHQNHLLSSCHDLSDGGLVVALAESCLGQHLGASFKLRSKGLSAQEALFSESNSRFIVSVSKENQEPFNALFKNLATPIGQVQKNPRFKLSWEGKTLIDLPVEKIESAFKGGLQLW